MRSGSRLPRAAASGQEHGLGQHNEPIRIVPADVPATVLDDYEGRYVSEQRGDTVEIRLEDGNLWIALEDEEVHELVPISEARLRMPTLPDPFEFVRDEAGVVTHFRIRMGLGEERFSRISR